MKTFDEAFDKIRQDASNSKELFEANFMAAKEYMLNEKWTTIITKLSYQAILSIVAGENPQVVICSILHSTFQLGLLTGLEMEKKDETFVQL